MDAIRSVSDKKGFIENWTGVSTLTHTHDWSTLGLVTVTNPSSVAECAIPQVNGTGVYLFLFHWWTKAGESHCQNWRPREASACTSTKGAGNVVQLVPWLCAGLSCCLQLEESVLAFFLMLLWHHSCVSVGSPGPNPGCWWEPNFWHYSFHCMRMEGVMDANISLSLL